MRILVWNCCNGLGNDSQIEQFKSFEADIAIIPELKEKNINKLNPTSAVWKTNNHTNDSPKGLGILSFNNTKLSQLPSDDDMEIFIPIQVETTFYSFNLLAFWNFYSVCKQGRFKGIKGEKRLEWEAIRHYGNLMTSKFIMAGDLNFGPTFSTKSFAKMCSLLSERGIKSLYHEFSNLAVGETDVRTYRHRVGAYHHLDHIFGSKFFCDNVSQLHVLPFSEVILSDHAPMYVDIKP